MPFTRPLLLLAMLAVSITAHAATTREVGPGHAYTRPSEAARVAQPGDRIIIAPGVYHDCAIWRAPDLTIEAAPGGPVEITGPVCGGKALFVTAAPRITIIGVSFRGAVADPGNGAGIRAEGGDLTIRRSRFIDNQNGILTANNPEATLLIDSSEFTGNGALIGDCAHGLYAGRLGAVVIMNSRFTDTRICHHVKSRAARTEIIDTAILDGEDTFTSYLIDIPNGGDLLVSGVTLRKGPRANNTQAAIVIGAEGVVHPTTRIVVRDTQFTNRMSRRTTFLRNLTPAPAELRGNTLRGPVRPLEGPGNIR